MLEIAKPRKPCELELLVATMSMQVTVELQVGIRTSEVVRCAAVPIRLLLRADHVVHRDGGLVAGALEGLNRQAD